MFALMNNNNNENNQIQEESKEGMVVARGTVNPAKGLAEVEYVDHVVSATGTLFTEEKLLQFIGLASYFRNHVPNRTEMVQPLRKLIALKKYKGSGKLVWTSDAIAAFEFCQQAISNYQELYFLEDTATPVKVMLRNLLWRTLV